LKQTCIEPSEHGETSVENYNSAINNIWFSRTSWRCRKSAL